MKALISLLIITSNLSGQVYQIRPICEEDRMFLHCRCLILESVALRLEDIANQAEESTREELLDEIEILKFTLGFPVELAD